MTRLHRIRRYFALHTYVTRLGWRHFESDVVELWQYWCFRLEVRLHRAWPFTLLAWLRSRGVPTVKGLGRFGENEVNCEPLTYHAEIIRATDKFGGNEKMDALMKNLATSDKDKFEHVRKTVGDAMPEMDYPHESGLSLDEFLRLERADAYMRQQREELEITRAKVLLAEAAASRLKAKDAQRIERWKTALAVSAGAAGVLGFLIAIAALFFREVTWRALKKS